MHTYTHIHTGRMLCRWGSEGRDLSSNKLLSILCCSLSMFVVSLFRFRLFSVYMFNCLSEDACSASGGQRAATSPGAAASAPYTTTTTTTATATATVTTTTTTTTTTITNNYNYNY